MSQILPQHRVTKSREVPLTRETAQGLVEAITQIFQLKKRSTRVEQIRYRRGEPLSVETSLLVATEDPGAGGDPDLFSPFQSLRQRAEIEVLESSDSAGPLDCVFQALTRLRQDGFQPTLAVTASRDRLQRWMGYNLSDALGITVYEDPTSPTDDVFIAGSLTGAMMWDAERAFLIRMQ